jgi:hypothetical protein
VFDIPPSVAAAASTSRCTVALNIARRVREGLEARSRPVDKGLRSSILFNGEYPYNVDSPNLDLNREWL